MESEQHIEIWVSNEEFEHIQAAARLSGRSISQFLVDAGLREAQKQEGKENFVHVSAIGYQTIFESLNQPARKLPKLTRAAKRFKRLLNSNNE